MTAFDDLSDIGPQRLFAGFLARAVHGDGLTFAIVEIEPGAALPEHRHENEQLGMVLRGSVTFRVGDEERELAPGGVWRIPPNAPHSASGGPGGAVVLDVFAPPREDWKPIGADEPRPPSFP